MCSSLSSPRCSKSTLKLTTELDYILNMRIPQKTKICFLESLIQKIKDTQISLKIQKATQIDPNVEQASLWIQLQNLQSKIIEKRLQKQEMENLITMQTNELEQIEQLVQIKKQILWNVNDEFYERTSIFKESQSEKVLCSSNQTEATQNNSFYL